MKQKELRIKIPEDVYSKLKEYADKKGISLKEYLMPYLEAIAKKESLDFIKKPPKSAIIVNKFKTKCLRCGKLLNEGDLVYWIEGVGVYCLDCYYSFFDKSLAKMYLRKRELERIVKELRKEANALADYINYAKELRKAKEILNECSRILNGLKWIMSRYGREHDTEIINKLLEIEESINEVKAKIVVIEKVIVEQSDKKKVVGLRIRNI